MKVLQLDESSPRGQEVLAIEEVMEKYNLRIIGNNLKLVIDGYEYNIGRDSCEFPRFVDEPFWREKDSD